MNLNFKVEISPDVLAQEISGETVLLDLKSESYFGLDRTATRIWHLLQETDDIAKVHRIMLAEFDVDPDELGNDLHDHLKDLEGAGLISMTRS